MFKTCFDLMSYSIFTFLCICAFVSKLQSYSNSITIGRLHLILAMQLKIVIVFKFFCKVQNFLLSNYEETTKYPLMINNECSKLVSITIKCLTIGQYLINFSKMEFLNALLELGEVRTLFYSTKIVFKQGALRRKNVWHIKY